MKYLYLEDGQDPEAFFAELVESGMSELQARAFVLKLQEEGFSDRDEISRIVDWIGVWETSLHLVKLGLAYLSFPDDATEPVIAVAQHAPEEALKGLDPRIRDLYKKMQDEARALAREMMH